MFGSGVYLARALRAAGLVYVAMTCSALAESKANQITVSANALDERFGISASYLYALSGDLAKDGALFRFGVGYSDSEAGEATGSVDALLGYQIVVGNWKMRLFAGAVVVDDPDLENPVGYKVLGQIQNKKTDDVYVYATAGYSSPKEQLNGSLQVGLQAAGLVVGPEVGAVVDPDFTRRRLGVFVTGIKLGDVGVTVRGGYTHYESDTESKGSAYVGASATLQY